MKNLRPFLILFTLTACDNLESKHNIGHFSEEVKNFTEVNSSYDDYNSTSPVISDERLLYFSSNRNTQGGTFDIIGDHISILWQKQEGKLTIDADVVYAVNDVLQKANTPANEFGPFSIPFHEWTNSGDVLTEILLYSSDQNGTSDIRFVSKITENDVHGALSKKTVSEAQPINFLNSDYNELYATLYGKGFYGSDHYDSSPGGIENLVYCSDASGNYDIYEVSLGSTPIQTPAALMDALTSSNESEKVRLPVNSDQDDKCPYVIANFMVFASNRAGGFGGYDLYYSIKINDAWSDPVNFGDRINTSSDEFRPILIFNTQFDNHLMIFSSNRPGGMGGFDLYYSGIPQIIAYGSGD